MYCVKKEVSLKKASKCTGLRAGLQLPQKTKKDSDDMIRLVLQIHSKTPYISFDSKQLPSRCFVIKRTCHGYERYPQSNMTRSVFLFATKARGFLKLLALQSKYITMPNCKLKRVKAHYVAKKKKH